MAATSSHHKQQRVDAGPEFITARHSAGHRPGHPIPLRVIHKGPSQLQRQIEYQRQLTRAAGKHMPMRPRAKDVLDEVSMEECTPLVQHGGDNSDEGRYMSAHPDVYRQLKADGYRLDELPDDEELDLIVPRPLHERYSCTCTCSIL